MEDTYDVVIIGGACAGLTAGLYASRRALKTVVITKDIGGQIATTPTVENYPGIGSIGGPELSLAMHEQALQWGAEIVFDEVASIQKRGEQDFLVHAANQDYQGRSIILAYGKTPRNLDIPGEKEYAGRGVSYCVTCDAPLFKGKNVVVVGGGNSAMEGALVLSQICHKVYLVHRRDGFRGEKVLLDRIEQTGNIEKVLSCVSKEIVGDGRKVTGLIVTKLDCDEERLLNTDAIFVEIGFTVNSALVENLVNLDNLKQIITNNRQETSESGIFAAGDLTDTPYKQAIISAGEGAKAALSAYSYLNQGKPIGVDWTGHA